MEKLESGAVKLGLHLSPRQLEQFSIYYQELVAWNQRMNLTTITGYKEIQVKHFLDALTVTLAFKRAPNSNTRIMDIGTGAGIPGVPIKILFPNIRLVLLEATAKKAAFLRHLKQKLRLDKAEIVIGRAEELAHLSQHREGYDIVLSRAVAPLPTLVELNLPFCAIGGSFIAPKKGNIELEISRAIKAINILGGNFREAKRLILEEFTEERRLVIIDKVSATPPQYPRRPGIPSKRPIS